MEGVIQDALGGGQYTIKVDQGGAMVRAQLPFLVDGQRQLIDDFLNRPAGDSLARDQLLNAVFLTSAGAYAQDREAWQRLITGIWHSLSLER